MYCGSAARLGSLTMPLRLSVLTRYCSMTHSRAERLPRRWADGLECGDRARGGLVRIAESCDLDERVFSKTVEVL